MCLTAFVCEAKEFCSFHKNTRVNKMRDSRVLLSCAHFIQPALRYLLRSASVQICSGYVFCSFFRLFRGSWFLRVPSHHGFIRAAFLSNSFLVVCTCQDLALCVYSKWLSCTFCQVENSSIQFALSKKFFKSFHVLAFCKLKDGKKSRGQMGFWKNMTRFKIHVGI